MRARTRTEKVAHGVFLLRACSADIRIWPSPRPTLANARCDLGFPYLRRLQRPILLDVLANS